MSQAKHKVTLMFPSQKDALQFSELAQKAVTEHFSSFNDDATMGDLITRAVAVRYKPVVKKGGQK